MLAVTSFHPEGYRKYGRRCLEGLSRHFPGKVVAYYEEKTDPTAGVEFRDFYSIPDAKRILERISRVFGSNGVSVEKSYDFRYDACKFSRKVFVQDAVFDEDDLVFWIDADCVIKQDIPAELLENMLKDVPLAYMGRKGKFATSNAYTETGFVGFNTKHPEFQTFRSRYLSYFSTGKIFSQLQGWHDCIAFDYARQGLSGNNLSPSGMLMGSVMHLTVLDPYMDHLKGNRKNVEHDGSLGSQA